MCVSSGLRANTIYTWKLQCQTEEGMGKQVLFNDTTISASLPVGMQAPSLLQLGSCSNVGIYEQACLPSGGAVGIRWQKPQEDGGADILRYHIQKVAVCRMS